MQFTLSCKIYLNQFGHIQRPWLHQPLVVLSGAHCVIFYFTEKIAVLR